MKKRLCSMLSSILVICILFSFVSCDISYGWCDHVDLDNDLICDQCGRDYVRNEDSADDKETADDKYKDEISCAHVDENGDSICDKCNEAFTDDGDMDEDKECKHSDSDNDFICDVCGVILCTHVDANNDFICDICCIVESHSVLILESIDGESTALVDMIGDINGLDVTVVNISDTTKMPETLDELSEYNEVILVNISNSDMPEGFDNLLYSYVNDIGGGLFTVCGNKEDSNPNDDLWEANAFTREDMYGTLYQKLLPLEVVRYTPPTAVMILIDTSGSMYNPDIPYEQSKLYAAIQGVKACLDGLTERDFIGIITFSDRADLNLALTSRTQRDKILAAIDDIIGGGGGTRFTPAIEMAGNELISLTQVENRHIILITDGEPSDYEEEYIAYMKRNADNGITMSIVGIDCTPSTANKMQYLLTNYAGVSADHFYNVYEPSRVPNVMREDIERPEIKEVYYETYIPQVTVNDLILEGIDISKMPTLDGFYASKPKNDNSVQVILSSPYVPIYAQWKVGKGMVGSFMCDLNGTWSSDFINSSEGNTIIKNIIIRLLMKKTNTEASE